MPPLSHRSDRNPWAVRASDIHGSKGDSPRSSFALRNADSTRVWSAPDAFRAIARPAQDSAEPGSRPVAVVKSAAAAVGSPAASFAQPRVY